MNIIGREIGRSLKHKRTTKPINGQFRLLAQPASTMRKNSDYCFTIQGSLQTTRSYTIASTTTSPTSDAPGGGNGGDVRTSKVKNEMDKLLAKASVQVDEVSKIILQGVQRKGQQNRDNAKISEGFKSDLGLTNKNDNTHSKQKDKTSNQSYALINVQNEIRAAEALLKLTSSPKFQVAFRQNQKHKFNKDGNKDVLHNFHYTFLSAIDWLCTTLSEMPCHSSTYITNFVNDDFNKTYNNQDSNASLLLNLLIDLNERSQKLNLPLTLPLYKKLCTMIARHSDSKLKISLEILDLSTVARDSLSSKSLTTSFSEDQVIQPSFFSDSMKELLDRYRIRDMIELFHGMRNVHNIESLDFQCGAELLSQLKEKVDHSIKNGTFIKPTLEGIDDDDDDGANTNSDNVVHVNAQKSQSSKLFDETDAMELAIILQEPVMKELTMKKKELEEFELNDAIDSLLEEDDCDDDDWDDEIVFESSEARDIAHHLNQSQPFENNTSENLEDDFEENSSDMEEEIKNLNELVKSMEYSNDDVNARQAAQSAAVAVLKKLQRRRKNAFTSEDINSEENENVLSTPSPNEDLVGKEITVEARNAVENARETLSEHERSKDIVDTVYLRDQNWELPDLVPQLEAWNSQTSLFFTKEYEDELISEMFGDDFDDDDKKKP